MVCLGLREEGRSHFKSHWAQGSEITTRAKTGLSGSGGGNTMEQDLLMLAHRNRTLDEFSFVTGSSWHAWD